MAAAAIAVIGIGAERRQTGAADQLPPEGFSGESPVIPRAVSASAASVPAYVRIRLGDGSHCSLTMDEYLRGVVPTEMPASWPLEALKAQAVAARTYAAAYHASYGYICATTACQAWDPTRRHPNSDVAVTATTGQVMTYQGELIWAYYSSACGGQTATSPGAAGAYCRSVRCWGSPGSGEATSQSLGSHEAARAFWTGTPSSYCSGSPNFRFTWSIDGSQMVSVINTYLPGLSTVAPRYSSGQLGQLHDVSVAGRSVGGRVTAIRISGSGGTWDVTGEWAIRSILRSSSGAASQRSTGVVVASIRSGTLTRLDGAGGGYGHAYGLCQYGARGMSLAGHDFRAILQHYYSGISIDSPRALRVPEAIGPRMFLPFLTSPTVTRDPSCRT